MKNKAGAKRKTAYSYGNITFLLSGNIEQDIKNIKESKKLEKKMMKKGVFTGNGWKILWKYQSNLLNKLAIKKYQISPYNRPKLSEKRRQRAKQHRNNLQICSL